MPNKVKKNVSFSNPPKNRCHITISTHTPLLVNLHYLGKKSVLNLPGVYFSKYKNMLLFYTDTNVSSASSQTKGGNIRDNLHMTAL